MPQRPFHICNHPGCGAKTKSTYCPAHTTQRSRERDRHRGLPGARGYDHHWRRLRDRKMKQDPACERCDAGGKFTLAEEVHHIISIAERPELRLALDNLQSLCGACHRAITAAQRSGVRG